MLTCLVAARTEAIATIPGPKGGWGYAYAAGDRGHGQQLLFHAPMVA
jgi:hypothetical protein